MDSEYLIYAVTDRRLHPHLSLVDAVEASIKGGVTVVQLREKDSSGKTFLESAIALKDLTARYDIPFIINDRIDIALLVGAGLHIGQDDIPLTEARRLLPTATIGVSVSTVEQAVVAEREGANYLGVGSLFPTATKQDATCMARATLEQIRKAVRIPLVGIGGITETNVPELGSLVDGYAVISALFANEDIERTTKKFKTTVKQVRQSASSRV